MNIKVKLVYNAFGKYVYQSGITCTFLDNRCNSERDSEAVGTENLTKYLSFRDIQKYQAACLWFLTYKHRHVLLLQQRDFAFIAIITQLALCFYKTRDTVYKNKQILFNKINLVVILGSYKKNKLVMTYISKLLRVWIHPCHQPVLFIQGAHMCKNTYQLPYLFL